MLFTACAFGLTHLLSIVNRLNNMDWNQKNSLGHTGLYLASVFGYGEIVKYLLDHGADVNASGGKYGDSLQAICFEGHSAIVQLLLQSGADTRLSGKLESAVHAAIAGGHEHVTLLILKGYFSVGDQAEYDLLLREAAQAGMVQVVQQLQLAYKSTYALSQPAEQKAVESAI